MLLVGTWSHPPARGPTALDKTKMYGRQLSARKGETLNGLDGTANDFSQVGGMP